MKSTIRIGTRGSALAFYQAELVKAKMARDFPLVTVECVKIKTSGDMIRRGGINPLETKRIYTREIEEALLAGEVDIAVHSAKDLAANLPEGLAIGAVLEREDPRDCLINREGKKIPELALGARIGTSSLRRKMQLLRMSPELVIEEVHGNVDTRIRKVEQGDFDAVVLAYAGVKRLGLVNCVSEIFPEDQFYPAPGQGAIVVESRAGDKEIEEVLEPLNHTVTAKRLECERAFLKRLEGGCQLPCGISTVLEEGRLKAKGVLLDLEGSRWAEGQVEVSAEFPPVGGNSLAELILKNGGQEILERIRHHHESSGH